jgi:hypothetical protein
MAENADLKPYGDDLPPPDYCDPVIEFYKKDAERALSQV